MGLLCLLWLSSVASKAGTCEVRLQLLWLLRWCLRSLSNGCLQERIVPCCLWRILELSILSIGWDSLLELLLLRVGGLCHWLLILLDGLEEINQIRSRSF